MMIFKICFKLCKIDTQNIIEMNKLIYFAAQQS